MERNVKSSIAAIVMLVIIAGCAARTSPNTSFEGKVAVYGDIVMNKAREAQKLVIAAGDTDTSLRPHLMPALDGFKIVFQTGETVAATLRRLDATNVLAEKQSLAETVKASMLVLDGAINDILVKVDNAAARAKIQSIMHTVRIAVSVFNLLQVLSPFLSQPAPVALLRGEFNGEYAFAA